MIYISTIRWMNPKELTVHQLDDSKTHLRADIRFKWTTFSLQGEHFITKKFWIPQGSPVQARNRVVHNLFAIIFFPQTVETEEFANLFVKQKSQWRWLKPKTKNHSRKTETCTRFRIKWRKKLEIKRSFSHKHHSCSCRSTWQWNSLSRTFGSPLLGVTT